jgi:hypothetical protein
MADGRAFTDYRQRYIIDEHPRGMGSEQYRQYLMHQASALMKIADIRQIEKNGCPLCSYQSTQIKHLYNI